MFCPSCRAEYRTGHRRCVTCDIELVDELPSETREEDLWAAPSVSIWQGADKTRAAEVAAQLEMAGIPTQTKTAASGDLFRVQVFPATERVAREVLLLPASEFAPPEDFAAYEKKVATCPICELDLHYKTRVCGRCLAEGIPLEREAAEALSAGSVHHPGDARVIHNKLRMAGIPFYLGGLDPGQGDVLVPRAPMQLGKYSFWVLEQDLEAAQDVIRSVPLHATPFDVAPAPVDNSLERDGRDEHLDYASAWQGDDREVAEALRYVFRESEIDVVLEESPTGALQLVVPPADIERARAIVKQVVEGVSMEEFEALDERQGEPDGTA